MNTPTARIRTRNAQNGRYNYWVLIWTNKDGKRKEQLLGQTKDVTLDRAFERAKTVVDIPIIITVAGHCQRCGTKHPPELERDKFCFDCKVRTQAAIPDEKIVAHAAGYDDHLTRYRLEAWNKRREQIQQYL